MRHFSERFFNKRFFNKRFFNERFFNKRFFNKRFFNERFFNQEHYLLGKTQPHLEFCLELNPKITISEWNFRFKKAFTKVFFFVQF